MLAKYGWLHLSDSADCRQFFRSFAFRRDKAFVGSLLSDKAFVGVLLSDSADFRPFFRSFAFRRDKALVGSGLYTGGFHNVNRRHRK